MELTSQAINEAEFSMARRGYDPDQVDEFLEKVAAAADELNEVLNQARERVAVAERRAAEAERRMEERPERVVEVPVAESPLRDGPSAAEVTAAAEAELETLKRTLVLAQKTADATIRDAQEEAQRMIADAETEARAAHEGTKATLLEEISGLDTDRATLRSEIEALQQFIDGERQKVKGTLGALQRLLDDPDRLKASTPPPAATIRAATPEPAPAPAAAPSPKPAPEAAPPPQLRTAEDLAAEEPLDLGDAAFDDEEAWARFSGGDLDEGPPTEPVLRLDEYERASGRQPDGEDAYLAELRKAMLDDTGAPGLGEPFADESSLRPRFGRRR